MSSTVTHPFGKTLTFQLGSLSVVIDQDSKEFKVGSGEGYLSRLGYDREEIPEYSANCYVTQNGQTVFTGPAFPTPHLFRFQFQKLTLLKYETLLAMRDQQRKTGQLIALRDARLVFSEPSPATRQSFGSVQGAPVIAGQVFYLAIFRLWFLDEGFERRQLPKSCNGSFRYDLSFAAEERYE